MSYFLNGLLLSFVGIALSASGRSQGLSDEEARQKARATVRGDLGLSESSFLNPHRREDLEEFVLSFEQNLQGRSAKLLYFFEISDEGYEVTSQKIMGFHSTDDGHMALYVAVDRGTGETYRLYGLKDAASEFNRMAGDLRLRVEAEADATPYYTFSAFLARRPRRWCTPA
jgi:hypothetical protein